MAIVDSFPKRRPPHNRKYDWATWTDGDKHKITRGVEFEVTPREMQKRAINHARAIGLHVRTAVEDDALYVQFAATLRELIIAEEKEEAARQGGPAQHASTPDSVSPYVQFANAETT